MTQQVLDDFLSMIAESKPIRKINVAGGMGGLYEEEEQEEQGEKELVESKWF